MVQYVDVIIANEEDGGDVFGILVEGTDVTCGELDVEKYMTVVAQLPEKANCNLVAITLRERISASDSN